jgi:phosphatidylserine/phosphatidylglycerophosphate/cardiolipin synthase-like enzyme
MEELPGLKVTMFLDIQRRHGDTTAISDLVRGFADRFATREWPGKRLPAVYYDPRSLETDPAKRSSLHAKCVVVDRKRALVSSANFTEAAQVRNIEVGALIRAAALAAALAQHFESLVGANLLASVPLGSTA